MSSVPLYKAFIEAGASEESATNASEDVIQVSQLPQLATKADLLTVKADIALLEQKVTADIAFLEKKVTADIALLEKKITADISSLRNDMADRESRLIKWMVGSLFVFSTIIVAGIGILFQILLSPGVAQ